MSHPVKSGAVFQWRGCSYRVERVYVVDARCQSIEYPGVFHIISLAHITQSAVQQRRTA
jgi:hypothetical protein